MIHFLFTSAFAAWVIFFGGAEKLEGTLLSFFVIDMFAPFLSAGMLKLYIAVVWIGDLIILWANHHG